MWTFWHVSEVLPAGVMLNKIFPDWTLTLLLVLLLGFLTIRVLQRGVRMWRAESADRVRAQGAVAGNGAAADGSKARQLAVPANRAGAPAAKEGGGADVAGVAPTPSVVASGRAPSALQRAGSAAALVAFWAAFAGAQAGKSLVDRCSLEFAGLSAAQARRPSSSALSRHQ